MSGVFGRGGSLHGLHAGVSMVFPGFRPQLVRVVTDGVSYLCGVAESLAGRLSGRGPGAKAYMIRYIIVRWCRYIISYYAFKDIFCLLRV